MVAGDHACAGHERLACRPSLGPGVHPTFVLLHGLPGNEKNLDLAQAVRRAGWNAITFNYRGSWGSPGTFRFGNNLEDADAVLRYVHDTSNARKLGIDPRRIVIAGHSMGGWVAALTAAHHPELRGVVLISAADMGRIAAMSRDSLTASIMTSSAPSRQASACRSLPAAPARACWRALRA
ncbi:MAG TPA: alpha/beta fold hydrolase [Gemmatimonadaceae bacterium]